MPSYVTDILPALLVFALGLSIVVAPLTATVLGAASEENAGVASAINTDVARVASLLAVAVIPVAAGISGADYLVPSSFDDGFDTGVMISAALCAFGGLLAFATIRTEDARSCKVEPVTYCPLTGPSVHLPEAAGVSVP